MEKENQPQEVESEVKPSSILAFELKIPRRFRIVIVESLDFHTEKDVVELQSLDDFLELVRSDDVYLCGEIMYDLLDNSNIVYYVNRVVINNEGMLVQKEKSNNAN